jgi:ABC-type transport system involved in multi-copper enzyme maturation permease subunit
MIVSALARQELLRTFRRRETFWTVLGLAVFLGVLPFGALLLFLGESSREWLITLEVVRRFGSQQETVILCVLSFSLGLRAVRSELESGSWVLLAGTPVKVSRILLGKTLGLLAALAILHVLLSVPSLTLGPTASESFRPSLFRWLLQLLFAFGFVPEGMLYGWMGRKKPLLTYALYPFTFARLAGLLLVLFGAAHLASGAVPRELFESHVASLAWKIWSVRDDPRVPFGGFFANAAVPWSIVLTWQAVTGTAYGWVLAKLAR